MAMDALPGRLGKDGEEFCTMQLKDVEALETTFILMVVNRVIMGWLTGLTGTKMPGWGEIAALPSFIVCWIAEESRADVYSGDQLW